MLRGYDVSLVVADGKGDAQESGVKIVDVGHLPGRFGRMLKTTRRVLSAALRLDADLYHLHDPELIPIGLKLKQVGKKVVFDSHEDVPDQILSKSYLWPSSRQLISRTFSLYERRACRQFDGIVTATPSIRDKFLTINPRTVDVNNFPVLGELDSAVPWQDKKAEICYVGNIGAIRGIRELVRANDFLHSPARLNLVGGFAEPSVEAEVKTYSGWARVNELGMLGRSGVREVMGRSVAGVVTFHSVPNHVNAQPNKMFEYMSSGIPVIASNFPLWRDIIEGNDCGICVDPLDLKAIAAAIDRLVTNPDVARRMGQNGRNAIMSRYNWASEERKLHEFYSAVA